MYTLERTNWGAVKITKCHFTKFVIAPLLLIVKGNGGGNANAHWEHDGASTLETWIHTLSHYGFNSSSPVFNPHCLTLFTHHSYLNVIPNELNWGALRCPIYTPGIIAEHIAERTVCDKLVSVDMSDWHWCDTCSRGSVVHHQGEGNIGDPVSQEWLILLARHTSPGTHACT